MSSSHQVRRITIAFIAITILMVLLFWLDLVWGTTRIPFKEVVPALWGNSDNETYTYILQNFRLPKALTALFTGAGISIAGLQMQNLFRNPLADTSILGISSGAGLGVAFYMMAFAVFPNLLPAGGINNSWGIIVSAFLGSLFVLLIISVVAAWLKDIISILIIGVMIGFLASSVISILQYFTDNETLKSYLIWSFGSLSGTTWNQLRFLVPTVSIGLFLSLLMPKYMNALNLGENYAQSVGINVSRVRMSMILVTSLITGTITAFTGPIAFLGIAVPHFTRMAFKTSDNRVLIPATILSGASLMLICDIITQLPSSGVVLPINAITSLIGAPVVILVITRNRRKHSIFH